jgi:hypothetical protein
MRCGDVVALNGSGRTLSQNVTEQMLLLGLGEYMHGDAFIQARDVIDPSYRMKSWEEYCREEDWSSIL